MTITMCTSGAVSIKAGVNVSGDITDESYNEWINQAESFVNVETRVNYTDTYAGLNDDLKKILEDAVSSHAAIMAINYDMSGYTSRAEAQTMLDVNYMRFTDAIRKLKEKYATDFISGT